MWLLAVCEAFACLPPTTGSYSHLLLTMRKRDLKLSSGVTTELTHVRIQQRIFGSLHLAHCHRAAR